MAKSLLLFIIFCLVFTSLAHAQCDKEYKFTLNRTDTYSSKFFFDERNYQTQLACKIELNINETVTKDLSIRWFRNDTLLNEKSPTLKSSQEGIFRLEIKDGQCNYKVGSVNVKLIKTIPISTSTKELIICDKLQSLYPIWANINMSYSDITYQWQKDGKDMPGETSSQIYPKSVGIYTVRATINNCSTTSSPINVKTTAENKIQDYLSIDNLNNIPITEDSLFLCQDNSYAFRVSNQTNWYFNGKQVAYGYTFTPTQSGTYYTQKKLGENCFQESKPVYISFGKKLSPFKINSTDNYIYCDQKTLYFFDKNFRGDNKLRIEDALTGELKYSFSNFENYIFVRLKQGKYILNYQTGSCQSEPQILDYTQTNSEIVSNGEKLGGKKITLCPNGSINVRTNHYILAEVNLFRDNILIQTKPANFNQYPDFNLSKTGKYHFEIINPECTFPSKIISDTVEIEVPESIPTSLTLSGQACNSKIISTVAYPGYTYSWYKNNQLIPNESSAALPIKAGELGIYQAVLQKDFCSVTTQAMQIGEKIQGQSTICQGGKLDLRSNFAGGTYLWRGPSNFSSNLSSIVIEGVDAKHAGWYVLQTTRDGCVFKDSIEVIIPAISDLSINFLNPMCVDKAVIIELKGKPGNYFFNYNFHGISASQKSVYLSSDQDNFILDLGTLGLFTPAGKKEFLEIQNASCLFPVSIPPRLSKEECQNNPDFVNVKNNYCVKENVNLEIRIPDGIPSTTKFNLRLQTWSENYNFGSFSGNKITIQIPEYSYSYIGYFILESEDGKYRVISKSLTVNNVKPNIYYLINNYFTDEPTHCKGYRIKIESNNPYNENLQWKKDGINIPGANSTTIETAEDGYYTLVASSNGCTAESSPVHLTSADIPEPAIYSLAGQNRACEGYAVPLKDDRNYAYSEYEWKRNGKKIEIKYTNDIFDAKETGYYSLTARQGSCEASSDSVFIEIGTNLNNSIYGYGSGLKQDNKILLCKGLTFSLSSDFYKLQYNFENFFQKYGLSFQWRLNDKIIPEATSTSYSSKEAGKYRLQVKQGDCIINSNEIEVVNQNPINIRLSSDYFDYSHDEPANSITICNKDSVGIYPYPLSTGISNWNKELYKNGKLIEIRNEENYGVWNNRFRIEEPGKYSLRLYSRTDSSCSAISDTLTIQMTDKPIILPIDSISSCNDIIGLHTNALGIGYEWTYDNKIISKDFNIETIKLGLHTLKIYKTEACYIEQRHFIERKLQPIINKYNPESWSSTICPNEELELSLGNLNDLEFGYEPGFVLEWYRNAQKLSDIKNNIKVNQAGNYFAKVTYKECEATSNVIKLDVVQIKNTLLPLVDSVGICINGGFQTLEAENMPGYSYEWFKDNISLNQNSSSLKATQSGTYKALIQSGDCSALTHKVKVYASTQLPTATISGDTILNIGDTANLKLSFTSSPPFTYKLSNNQEGTSDKNTTTHPVKVEEATIFKLASIKNACGEGTVSGEAKVNVVILGNEPLIGHKITIAPVPAETYCEIIFDLPVSQEVSYQLLDMKGQQLSEKNLGKVMFKKQYLNLNNLTAGEYLIKVQIGKEFVTRKLIKY